MKTKILVAIDAILAAALVAAGIWIFGAKRDAAQQKQAYEVQIRDAKQEAAEQKQAYEAELANAEQKYETLKERVNLSVQGGLVAANPVDMLFAEGFGRSDFAYQWRGLQELYLETWKNQYSVVMGVIRGKCRYDEDIANYDAFIKEMERELEKGFEKKKPLILNTFLDNFDLPESPEKHGWGNGTGEGLDLYKGAIYRNACMYFANELDGEEYSLPAAEVKAEIDKILSDSGIEVGGWME